MQAGEARWRALCAPSTLVIPSTRKKIKAETAPMQTKMIVQHCASSIPIAARAISVGFREVWVLDL